MGIARDSVVAAEVLVLLPDLAAMAIQAAMVAHAQVALVAPVLGLAVLAARAQERRLPGHEQA